MYKVLIVDDEELAIQYLSVVIEWEKKGYERPRGAVTVTKALEIFRALQPDIVICDIRMPEMDGLELLRCMREISTDFSSIVLTAYRDFEVLQEAIKDGIGAFLLKHDLTDTTMLAALEKVCRTLEHSRRLEKKAVASWLRDRVSGKEGELIDPEISVRNVQWQFVVKINPTRTPTTRNMESLPWLEFEVAERVQLQLWNFPRGCSADESIIAYNGQNCTLLMSDPADGLDELEVPELLSLTKQMMGISQGKRMSIREFITLPVSETDYAVKAAQMIHEQYAKPLKTEVIAEQLFVSNGYLRACFKKRYNCTLSEYLRRYRIEEACNMLRDGGYRIFEIAEACGFVNSQHFSQVFKMEKGMTPHEYERNQKGNR